MKIDTALPFVCPYCNFEQFIFSSFFSNSYTSSLIRCDVEEGGCDKLLVLKPKVEISISTLKVEGEE